jgi:hypothetical protein
MADERAKRHIERYNRLKGSRSVWSQHAEDLVKIMQPGRMGFASTPIPGDRRTDDLYDGTPMQAARGLANATGGMLRPEKEKWFFLKAVDDYDESGDEGKDWLADTEERMRKEFDDPRARFRQATGETDLDLAVIGTAVLYEGEGTKRNHLLFQSIHLKDACPYFDEDGRAAGLYRVRRLTLRQAMEKFGLGALSDASKEAIRNEKYEDETDFLHCVTARAEGRADALLNRNFPYTDTWIEMRDQRIVSDGGFREFPFIVPRWDTSSGEEYGRSPGMIALPDASTLQAMGATLLIAGQRNADPPLAVPFDGAFSEINTVPGGLAYYDPDVAAKLGGSPFFPIESGAKMPIMVEMQRDMRQQVWAAFLRNILNLPVEGPQMTATEVIQRREEIIREIGPVFGRLETDYTAPMVERAFKIMLRANAFLPAPAGMRAVRFEYESPVKRIRQSVEAAAARLWVNEHIEAAKATGREDILDAVNFDEYSRFTAESSALPHRILNGKDVVARIRKERADKEQQLHAAAMAEQVAGAAKTTGEIPGFKQALENAGSSGAQPKKAA